jgi:HD-GYP domain-containing protein (c-di-GMP phosphodiesterase class II)
MSETHTQKGQQIIDQMLLDLGLESEYVNILRNIAEHHHETLDGKGYPQGLSGDQISMESRIVAVADVFGALTSCRPYKEAWTNDDALGELRKLACPKLDPDCVHARSGIGCSWKRSRINLSKIFMDERC